MDAVVSGDVCVIPICRTRKGGMVIHPPILTPTEHKGVLGSLATLCLGDTSMC